MDILQHATQSLDGYAFTEWPNLSADRFPSKSVQVTSQILPLVGSFNKNVHVALISIAIARTIGAYCGANDILLALAANEDGTVHHLRITWNDDKSWEELISDVNSCVSENSTKMPLSIPNLRNMLCLGANQHPCLALCSFSRVKLASNPEYPAIFSYDIESGCLELCAPQAILHPTVNSQIVAQIYGLVDSALHHPKSKVADIPSLSSNLLSISERRTEEEVAKTYSHIAAVSFAPDYLAERAKDMPMTTAVRWYPELTLDSMKLNFESISYMDLDIKSNKVARWLRRNGLQPEGRVCVCLDRNLEFHAVMMGIMRAGGCYVPIDPELPLERKIYIAKDADASFVLTSPTITSSDVFGEITRFIEDPSVQEEIARESGSPLDLMKPEGLAYLLYTSGTTGNPKGCLLTHRGLSQAILALSSTAADVRMDNIHDGRYLAVASIAFDVHLAETIVPIALGMPLISARRSQLLENLPIYANKLGVTHLGIVPSLIEATLNVAENEDDMVLRYIASGGEKMSDSILDKWADHPQVRLANFYGPSEVTIGCCARYMTSSTPRANIGRALASVSAYVVDSDMNILLRGSVGELVVEGPLVGRGYQGRSDLTEKVFAEWPHPGCWAYRTGDLVRMMPDCTIEIVGRIDTQIKLRGVRIESEGISAIVRNAVSASESISLDVTTVLAKHPVINVEQLISLFSWDKTISVATRKSKRPEVVPPPPGLLKRIKAKCEEELPGYMRPGHLIPLSWLPLSSNGKIDAKVLTRLFCDLDIETLAKISIDEQAAVSRPCTNIEMKVFDVLTRHITLPIHTPYPELNVFEYGLDSMAVIRFSSELKKVFGVNISASAVMKQPRLSGIAESLQLSPEVFGQPTVSPNPFTPDLLADLALHIKEDEIEQILTPFTVQEGVLARSSDSDGLYVQHVVLALHSSVSMQNLRNAWKTTVARHPILRTIFHFGRHLSQVILKPNAAPLLWKDHNLLHPPQDFAGYFLEGEGSTVAQEINHSISSTPPYRLSAYSTSTDRFLVLSIHHALFDGISLPLIFREVEREYLGQTCQEPTSAAAILAHISSINLDNAKRFWGDYFTGFFWAEPYLNSVMAPVTQRQVVPLESSLSSLKAAAASQQVTLQALLTSAFSLLVAKHIYRRRDVAFGVLRSGRLLPIDDIDSALYPLISVVPIRVNFDHADTSLRTIQDAISSIVEYEQFPLGKVQGWVRPGKPLFDILFSLSVDEQPTSELWDVIKSEPPKADYLLAVEVVLKPANDSLLVQAAWLNNLDDRVVSACLSELETVVEGFVANSAAYIKQSLSEIPRDMDHRTVNGEDDLSQEEVTFTSDVVLLEKLQSIIADFLQIHPSILTPSTSFISMGLDSIKSVGLAKAITKQGYPITSSSVLRNATLQQLASCIYKNAKADVTQDAGILRNSTDIDAVVAAEILAQDIKFDDGDDIELFPTTALQTGMLSQTVNSRGKLYLHSFPLHMTGTFDANQLQLAWKTAVETFAILRSSFHFSTETGAWIQATHTHATLNWEEMEVNNVAEYNNALQKFLGTIKLDDESSFRRPPFWVRLFHHGISGSTLVFVMHHALYDGTSIGLLLGAVESFYHSRPFHYEAQFHDILPHILVQQCDGATFWAQRLAGLNPARLKRVMKESQIAVTLERHIPLCPTRVRKVLNEASVTMQCVSQVAWAKVIGRYTGSADVVFGHTVSGRSIPGSEDVIGPILNTIPCCIRLEKDILNIQLLRKIHRANIDALPYQQASTRDIQKALKVDGLWDSLFLFQSAESNSTQVRSPFWTFDEDSGDRDAKIQYPLNVEISHCDTGVNVKCASDPAFVNQEDLESIMDSLSKCFADIVERLHERAFTDLDTFLDRTDVVPKPQEGVQSSSLGSHTPAAISHIDQSIYQSILMSLTNAPRSFMHPDTQLVSIGIDSITAIQIAGKFRKAGMVLTASDVVSSITIGQMLSKIKMMNVSVPKKRGLSTPSGVSEIERAEISSQLQSSEIEQISPTSSGMQWLIGMWGKSLRTRFQHVFPFKLAQGIDKWEMKASWFKLMERHPILRSTFACPSGCRQPRIVTLKNPSPESWVEEYGPSEISSESLMERMKTMVTHPISTSQSQARALFLSSPNDSYLILHLHHFQYDAWSLPLLIHDLTALYRGTTTSVSCDMHSFLEYYNSKDQEHLEEQRNYWVKCFAPHFKPAYFPSLKSHSIAPLPTQRVIRTSFSCISNASQLDERARSFGVSLQSIFLASWARIQGDISKTSSSTFGLWHTGRTGTLSDIENLAVPCMNVLPMHVQSLNEKSALDLAVGIGKDLHERTSVIEQSNQVNVNEWIGAGKNPLCNVYINIIKVAPDISEDNQLFTPVQAPYFVPTEVFGTDDFPSSALDITPLIKDDLFIDFVVVEKTDAVMMSIDSAAHLMSEIEADGLIRRWSEDVQDILRMA